MKTNSMTILKMYSVDIDKISMKIRHNEFL